MKRRRFHSPAAAMGLAAAYLLSLATLIGHSTAVQVQFEDCYKPGPGAAHFKPFTVDAKFGDQAQGYPLTIEVHGNLTAPGQIIRNVDESQRFLTTLRQKVNVLSYTPLIDNSAFCDNLIDGTTCDILPVPNAPNFQSLPGFATTHNLSSSYAFSTFINTYLIIPAENEKANVGCIRACITPKLGSTITSLLTFIPVGILIMAGIATIIAAIFNPWNGTKDIFKWSSNAGRDEDMLRLVTPGFADCLQYLQFVVLSGALSLNYPGFYQPVIANGAWSVLMFNFSLVSGQTTQNPVDNIYAISHKHGLGRLTELVGHGKPEDAWAGFMVIFSGIIGATILFVALVAVTRWGLKRIKLHESGDLRGKNIPFLGGLLVRVVYNYLLLPILALSAYQLVIAGSSPLSVDVISGIVFAVVVIMAIFLVHRISTYTPRSPLYDDLPTLLFYGPLYNTYDESATLFCIVYLGVNIIRGVTFGFLQPSGIAQLTLLAICEIIFILTLNTFRPYSSKTSMNIYQIFFSAIRLISVLFQVAFVPSLEVDDAAKGWIGYVILILHGVVLVFGFFMNALQTFAEVAARLAGAGEGRDGAQRGGLSRRQLARRMNRPEAHSPELGVYQSANAGTINEERKTSLMTGSRHGGSVSGSSAILLASGVPAQQQGYIAQTPSTEYAIPVQDTASSQGRGHQHTNSGSTTFGPATPRHPSGQSYFDNAGSAMQSANGSSPRLPPPSGLGTALANLNSNGQSGNEINNPYYRQPRKNRVRTQSGSLPSPGGPEWDNGGPSSFKYNVPTDYTTREVPDGYSNIQLNDMNDENARFGHSNPALMVPHTDSMGSDRKVQDYTQRESDFYYGVRGPALSAQPSRRLRTGPADPTSTVASATGWINKFSRWTKGKNKEKGFQVVRSARAPPPMRSAIEGDDEPTGVAIGKAPQRSFSQDRGIDEENTSSGEEMTDSEFSDDDEEGVGEPRPASQLSPLPPVLPEIQTGDAFTVQSRINSKKSAKSVKPHVPRKSSKRRSRHLMPVPTAIYQSLPETPERVHGSQLYDPPLHENRSTSSTHRLPFTRPAAPQNPQGDAGDGLNTGDGHSNYSTSSSMLVSPAMIAVDDDASSSRPASLGRVTRHKTNTTTTTATTTTTTILQYGTKQKQQERASRISFLPAVYSTPLTAQDRSILSTPIGTLAAHVRKKEWKPVDVLRAYGKKSILAHEKTNCLTEIMISEAEEYTTKHKFDGPLAGVPISMKDTVAVKGYDYCIGYSSLVNHPATADSPLTKLLKDAGCVPYVKTNVPITLLSFESTNDVFGRTSNPHNVDYSPGGSTGGESALLAYGGSRIGIGTDVAGSVRVPAHFSGIYTVRAATGRFMKTRNNTSMAGQEGVLAVYSPMARTYEDLEYFWRSYLSMKPWTYDHHTHPIPWREDEFEAGKTGKLRYGVMRDDGVVTPSPACARALSSVVDTLREAGEDVVELDLKEIPSPYEALKLASILLNNDGGKTYESFFTSWFEYNDAGVAKMSKWFKMPWILKKMYVWWTRYVQKDEMWAGLLDTHWREQTTQEQWKLVSRREEYRAQWHDYMNAKGIDILLCVPNATPAVPKDGMSTAVASCGYTFIFNLLDYSAGVLPITKVNPAKDQLPADFNIKKLNGIAQGAYVHYDAAKMAGLPVGVQIVGRRLEEEKVLGVMSRVEDLLEKKGEKYELLEVD
ncbi:hypothetical protein H072_4393 [Dactylellina haptotyla CBS 200.50]|uniref:amidase n=1 Tax=Dactylellina haptotyla (strain CBS 200.50) TaxID=1284197 RepID=S8AF64_DACHA|nr:hypothetical protein H072_4393 [Dactylellina haptotyla CBS 200.50]